MAQQVCAIFLLKPALPPVKIHCSILAEDAIKAAVLDYKTKHAATATAA